MQGPFLLLDLHVAVHVVWVSNYIYVISVINFPDKMLSHIFGFAITLSCICTLLDNHQDTSRRHLRLHAVLAVEEHTL